MARNKSKPQILLVEDIAHTVDQLLKLLQESLGDDVIIITAMTVNDALAEIARAVESGIEFAVAIIDIKLPRDHGDHPEVDLTVREEVIDKMRHTHVVHITGYPEDPMVQKLTEELEKKDAGNPRPGPISKLDTNWPFQLLRIVRTTIYGNAIEGELDELFGTADSASARLKCRPAGRTGVSGGATHRLAALSCDIAAHWDDLDGPLQSRVERIFKVDTSGNGVRVSLL